MNHLIAIDEVLGSWQGDDTVQFVELRLLARRPAIALERRRRAGRHRPRLRRRRRRGRREARLLVHARPPAIREAGGARPHRHDRARGADRPDAGLRPARRHARSRATAASATRVNPPQGSFDAGVIDCVAYGKFAGENGSLRHADARTRPTTARSSGSGRAGRRSATGRRPRRPRQRRTTSSGAALQTLCGDGVISQGEACDGNALGGKTCESLGFAKGTRRLRAVSPRHARVHRLRQRRDQREGGVRRHRPRRSHVLGARLHGRRRSTAPITASSRRGTAPRPSSCPDGGPAGPECLAEWRIANATARPGASGRAPVRQRCKDGDPGCDADLVAGTCTFTVAVCFDRDDARLARAGRPCRLASIESFAVLAPPDGDAGRGRARRGGRRPRVVHGERRRRHLRACRSTATERCTEPLAIAVPTRGTRPGVLVLKTRTTASGGHPRDVDTLKLVCTP